jgi:Fic family protein
MTSPQDLIAFSPAYRRYTPEVLEALMRIAHGLGTIQGARVLPAVADQLRANARVGTVHYSNLIEGNQLGVIAAERAARRELAPDTRAKIELVNYVDALDLIDGLNDRGELRPTQELLLEIHGTLTRGLGREDESFKPHHEGAWRDGMAVVVDHLSGRIMHEGPPPEQVGPRMAGLFSWLERRLDAGDPAFVLAGVVHYAITDVHPFADGNGRAARLFQAAIMMYANVLPGQMFSFERYYAEDRAAYYAALRSVRERTLNMEWWLEYFLNGLAEEYERVADTVADLSALMPGGTSPLRLSRTQERGLTALRLQGRSEFTRSEYETASGVGRSTAGSDLTRLVEHGVLRVRGGGTSTRYAFVVPGRPSRGVRRGRPRLWTDARIEQELRAYLADQTGWPPAAQFRADGQGALYAAASNAGGVGRWRAIVGA